MLNKSKAENDVGASKAARVILGSLDRRLREPAGFIVRVWGFVLVALVAYLLLYGVFGESERYRVGVWIIGYIAYLFILEIIRAPVTRIYDTTWFRAGRIAINIIIMTLLIRFSSSARFILAFTFTVPIFAATVYFSEHRWINILVITLAIASLYVGGVVFTIGQPLTWYQLCLIAVVLAVLSYSFYKLYSTAIFTPSRLADITRELGRSLDLQKLMSDTMQIAIELTHAQRVLLVVTDPRSGRYISHVDKGFVISEGHSIEDFVKKCSVLSSGLPFECHDLTNSPTGQSIYLESFQVQPRSILAEPLFSAGGRVLGVLNVAHDNPSRFDRISKNLLHEFSILVSNTIENCLNYREVKLREARSREVGKEFAVARSEDEVAKTLINDACQQIPHAERYVLHRYIQQTEELVPVAILSPDESLDDCTWSVPDPENKPASLRIGYGIAGHAIKIHETILANDVKNHPWYVELNLGKPISSLLVAPLFNPNNNNEPYGTISLQSSKPFIFTQDDEYTIANITTQGSLALVRLRDFENWREHGSTLQKVLDEIRRRFDLRVAEEVDLCDQIVKSATRLLGYKVACIRLLDPKTNRLEIIAVSGISKGRFNKLRGKSIDYLMLKPFFSERYKIGHSYLIPHENHEWQEFARKHFNIPRQTLQKKSGWRAYDALATPLTDQSDNLIGLLTLDVPNTGTLPNVQTIETIGVFTSAASWMIELYRFQKRLIEQKQRASSFINTISEDLAKGHNFETIGEVVVQAGAKLLSVEGCSLYIVRGKFIELTHSTYLSELGDIRRRKPISTQPKSGLTSWVAATGEVLRLDSTQLKSHSAWAGEEEHLRYLPSKTCHSLLIVPVKSKTGKVMGVITLENKKAIRGVKDFDEEDQAHLMSLASEFAKALESIGRYAAIIEWERVGFEDDIHDLINWYHSGVVLWIDAIDEWLKRDDIAKAKELMPGLMYHAHTTVEELKSVHANILSQALEADSLSQAFNRMIKTWKTRFKPKYDAPMKIKLNCPKDIDIPVRLRNTLIRIASLAFSNAIKHSGIIEDPNVYIQIDIARIGDLITLTVSDNGKGMENIIEGYGITRMKQLRERIKSWDGIEADIQFDAALGRGTKVILSIQIGELETS